MAERFAVTVSTVTLWETGKARPLPGHYARIIQFLGYDPIASGNSLPARLGAARRRLGLTLAELARRTGFNESSLSRWLNHGRRPSRWTEARIRFALDQLGGANPCAPEGASFDDLSRWRRSPSEGIQPRTFGERLRASRLKLGLTQSGLEKRLGVGVGAVREWESGRRSPSKTRRAALRGVLKRLAR